MGFHELSDSVSQLALPPGFRFYPTDEELLVQYLCRKVAGDHFSLQIIGEIDLYKFDPWILPSKATFGEKEWYFFSPRDRKYPNGTRPNRVAGTGYWKATGTDKLITTEGRKVGIKKALVFYVGKAPKGTKTNWIMHEYRLIEHSRKFGSSKLDDWVLCRIYKKKSSAEKVTESKEYSTGNSSSSSSQQIDDMLDSLPEMNAKSIFLPRMNTNTSHTKDSPHGVEEYEKKPFNIHTMEAGNFDWESIAAASSENAAEQLGRAPNYYGFSNLYEDQLGRVEEEAQSGLSTDGYNYNSGGGFVNSPGQMGVRRYLPMPSSGFGFTQQ